MARPGFCDENRHRAFPFLAEGVGLPAGGGLKTLPDGVVVDCGFVTGVDSGFISGSRIFLHRVVREGDTFFLDFGTDAAALAGSLLRFTRSLGGPDYESEQVDSAETHAGSWSDEDCDEPLWSGYLVSGRIENLVALLPADGEVVREPGDAVVEPALVQNLAGSYVKMIALANQDRTRVTNPVGCDEAVWPYEIGITHVNARCLQGDLLIRPGYNCKLRQDAANNALILSASVGAGEGEPCGEFSHFEGEVPPSGSNLLGGGPACGEVLRSFNGVGGRLFNFSAGRGVRLTPDPAAHTLTVDVDLSGLAACGDGDVVSVSETL